MVLRELRSARNYRALWQMMRRAPDFRETARRYFLGGGEYPWRCRVRTPLGTIAPRVYSHHDVWTVNEVFFREDYKAPSTLRIAVDIGSNIGISALYFLTRNPQSRVYLFEADARNVERLRANVEELAGRCTIEHAAVVPVAAGDVTFVSEETGRYGHVAADGSGAPVNGRGINEVLESVLAREPRIDLLKIDTEGLEVETIRAIRADVRRRIEVIYFESTEPAFFWPGEFEASFSNETVRLRRRG
jgi:FkbM family methyltransferase